MLLQRYLVMSLKKLDHFLHMIPIESLYHVSRTFLRDTEKIKSGCRDIKGALPQNIQISQNLGHQQGTP